MALVKAAFAPGIDKQTTTYGAEGRWVDSKNVRFRTGLPEKIGGWEKVITSTSLLYTTPSPPDGLLYRMPGSA